MPCIAPKEDPTKMNLVCFEYFPEGPPNKTKASGSSLLMIPTASQPKLLAIEKIDAN